MIIFEAVAHSLPDLLFELCSFVSISYCACMVCTICSKGGGESFMFMNGGYYGLHY